MSRNTMEDALCKKVINLEQELSKQSKTVIFLSNEVKELRSLLGELTLQESVGTECDSEYPVGGFAKIKWEKEQFFGTPYRVNKNTDRVGKEYKILKETPKCVWLIDTHGTKFRKAKHNVEVVRTK